MITGGYNIIDFEGVEFQVNVPVKLTDEVIEKLTDTSKPTLVGNFYISNAENTINLIITPSFAQSTIDGDGNIVTTIGAIVILTKVNSKDAVFQLYD